MTSPAAFAAQEFKRRQALAQQARDGGRMSRDAAEARLWPWLAIACAVGADLPELVDPANGRRLYAFELCEPGEYRETLARARDEALNKEQGADYTRGLLALAAALRCRPWHPSGTVRIAA